MRPDGNPEEAVTVAVQIPIDTGNPPLSFLLDGGTAPLVFAGTKQVVRAGEPLPTLAFSIMALRLKEGNRAGDSVLGRLSRLPAIRQLDLSGQPVTDAGLKHLQPLKSLRTLNLQNTGVTAPGVEALRQELPA